MIQGGGRLRDVIQGGGRLRGVIQSVRWQGATWTGELKFSASFRRHFLSRIFSPCCLVQALVLPLLIPRHPMTKQLSPRYFHSATVIRGEDRLVWRCRSLWWVGLVVQPPSEEKRWRSTLAVAVWKRLSDLS